MKVKEKSKKVGLKLNIQKMKIMAFDPWVGKIPWRWERIPTPVFWPGEFQGVKNSQTLLSCPITSWQIDGETVKDFIFGGPKSLQMVIAAMKLKNTYSLEGKL